MSQWIPNDILGEIGAYMVEKDQLAYRTICKATFCCSAISFRNVKVPIRRLEDFMQLVRQEQCTFRGYVRGLLIIGEGSRGSKFDLNRLTPFLRLLPNVNRLEFYHINFLQSSSPCPLQNIKEVQLLLCFFDDSAHFLSALILFPDMCTLTCGGISYGDPEPRGREITLPELKNLGLAQTPFFPEKLCKLFQALVKMPKLQSLYLKGAYEGVSIMEEIMHYLGEQPNLVRVSVEASAEKIDNLRCKLHYRVLWIV